MAQVSARDVALDPQWLPHTYDAQGSSLTCVLVPRAARSDLVFLSEMHLAGKFEKLSFPRAALAAAVAKAPAAPIHFIFHSSHCCSTLLGKALEVAGVSSLLNEPDVMINLANRFIRVDDPANRERLQLVLRLFERPFTPEEAVIVKPSNSANRLAETVLSMRPGSRAIILYSSVETLLFSLAKRGMFGWIFARQVFNQIKQWSPLDFGYSPRDLLEQTDMQVTALAWLMQIHHLDAISRAFGPGRVMVLDSADFIANPAATLERTQELFGLGLDSSQIEAIVSGPVFAKHSKTPGRDYDANAREREQKTTAELFAKDVRMVAEWIKAVAEQIGAPLRPGSQA